MNNTHSTQTGFKKLSTGEPQQANLDDAGNLYVNVAVGGGGGGGATTIADGADVAEGATADAAVVTDAAGTVSGKLRGLVKIFADIWDSTNNFFRSGPKVSTTTGTIAGVGQTVTASLDGKFASASFQLLATGGPTGTLTVEVSVDSGTTYVAAECWNPAASYTGPIISTNNIDVSVTSSGIWTVPLPPGATHLRFRGNGWGSGSWALTVNASTFPAMDRRQMGQPIISAPTNGGGSGQQMLVNRGGAATYLIDSASGSPVTVTGSSLSDAFANPNELLEVQSFPYMYNGATHDRLRGDTTSGLFANIKGWFGSTVPTVGQKTMASSIPVAIASNQSVLSENLTQVGGSSISLGQTTMASSVPVAIASNQSALGISHTQPTAATATWTSATPFGTELDLDVSKYNSVVFTCVFSALPSTGVIWLRGSSSAGSVNVGAFALGLGATVTTSSPQLIDRFDASSAPQPIFSAVMNVAGLNQVSMVLLTPLAVGLSASISISGSTAAVDHLVGVLQGPSGSNADAWWTQIGDTTNGPVAVKAASTAAVATDPALVVAISPNNPIGGGTQYADGAARGTATGTLMMVDDATNIQSAKGDTDGTLQVNLTKVNSAAPNLAQETGGNLATLAAATHLEDVAAVSGDRGVLTLGVRQDILDGAPSSGDGDYQTLLFDRMGQLRVSTDSVWLVSMVEEQRLTNALLRALLMQIGEVSGQSTEDVSMLMTTSFN